LRPQRRPGEDLQWGSSQSPTPNTSRVGLHVKKGQTTKAQQQQHCKDRIEEERASAREKERETQRERERERDREREREGERERERERK
jgi:hypothetical protein